MFLQFNQNLNAMRKILQKSLKKNRLKTVILKYKGAMVGILLRIAYNTIIAGGAGYSTHLSAKSSICYNQGGKRSLFPLIGIVALFFYQKSINQNPSSHE